MRGRKPVPTHLRLLRGNPGRRPLPQIKPEPEVAIPEKPDWLDAEASAEWDRVTPILHDQGLLSHLDRAIFVKYCQAWSAVVALEADVDEVGWWVPTGDGGRKRNPCAASLREAYERLHSAASEFGMTPVSRSRISASGSQDVDPLDELAERRRKRP